MPPQFRGPAAQPFVPPHEIINFDCQKNLQFQFLNVYVGRVPRRVSFYIEPRTRLTATRATTVSAIAA